jgi:hypothetical protein
MATIQEREERMGNFIKYADKLFSNVLAPEPNSLRIAEIDLKNKDETGLLYELFGYGFNVKRKEFLTSNNQNKIDLASDPKRMFDYISTFIQAAGYLPVWHGVEKDDNGNVVNINMSFNSL